MIARVKNIEIIPIKPNNGLIGFANFIFDNALYCSSIGIYTRKEGGLRLTYPTRTSSMGKLPVFHPIDKETTNSIEKAVLEKLETIYFE